MKTHSQKLKEKAEEIFMNLYYQGHSVNDIKQIANDLVIIGNEAVENNTINDISNGRLNIKKVWSRKGRCPSCNVSTGSRHNISCTFKY